MIVTNPLQFVLQVLHLLPLCSVRIISRHTMVHCRHIAALVIARVHSVLIFGLHGDHGHLQIHDRFIASRERLLQFHNALVQTVHVDIVNGN
jgi:hypothetical protein